MARTCSCLTGSWIPLLVISRHRGTEADLQVDDQQQLAQLLELELPESSQGGVIYGHRSWPSTGRQMGWRGVSKGGGRCLTSFYRLGRLRAICALSPGIARAAEPPAALTLRAATPGGHGHNDSARLHGGTLDHQPRLPSAPQAKSHHREAEV